MAPCIGSPLARPTCPAVKLAREHRGRVSLCCTVMHAQMGFIPGHEKVQGIVGVAVCNSKKYMACIENVDDTEAQQVQAGTCVNQRV